MMHRTFAVLVLLGAATQTACAGGKPEPLAASSAKEAGYAERYPEAVSAARERLTRQEEQSRELISRFAAYPEQVKDPSWPHVIAVVDRADEAGRGAGYASRAAQVVAVTEFYEEEKAPLQKKVAGSAQYFVKQKGCEVEGVYGTTVQAMDSAMEKQLEEHLRAHNEAHRFINDNEGALGKPNVEKLEKQADEISFASYLAHVAVKQTRDELKNRIEEAEEIKKTLDRVVEESSQVAADANRTEADKAAAQKRLESAKQARGRIDAEAKQADTALKDAEQRAKKLGEDYDKALASLKTALQAKADAAKPQN
jgi:chromosome segregation ATPase